MMWTARLAVGGVGLIAMAGSYVSTQTAVRSPDLRAERDALADAAETAETRTEVLARQLAQALDDDDTRTDELVAQLVALIDERMAITGTDIISPPTTTSTQPTQPTTTSPPRGPPDDRPTPPGDLDPRPPQPADADCDASLEALLTCILEDLP